MRTLSTPAFLWPLVLLFAQGPAAQAPNCSVPCTVSQSLSNAQTAAIAPDGIGQSFTACGRGEITRIRFEVASIQNTTAILRDRAGRPDVPLQRRRAAAEPGPDDHGPLGDG